jgi:DNA adenine methylase
VIMSAVSVDRPLFRWAGSKRKLLPHLKLLWSEEYIRYLEPFAGSACLYFNLNPKTALLNDRNPHVISTYRAVRDEAKEVHEIVTSLPRTSDFYYRIRPIALSTKDPLLRAAFFIYLNRNCFNGLFRTNKFGQFNVPFSGSRTGTLPTSDSFQEIAARLKRARLFSRDFQEFVLQNVTAGDFVYLDPPYALDNERIFTQYGLTTFGTTDLKRLDEVLHHINNAGATFVLSYADSHLARKIFARWSIDDISVERQIASFAANRRKVSELIITNAAALGGCG